MNTEFAPIALFVYNRPEHTKSTIEGLLSNPESSNTNLYIFADGPKKNISEKDLTKLNEVRSFIHTVKGFKNVYIEELSTNKGLAPNTIDAMSKMFNKFDKVIMFEDDDVPSPFFLSYMNRCLNKYEKDPTIWCVSGYTDTSYLTPHGSDDLFLVNRPSSWGFGTWRRCWNKVIWDLGTLKGIFKHRDIINKFNKWGGNDSAEILFNTFDGISSSWSIRYNFAAYLNNAYTILPNKSLIFNIGCDGSGTHCGNHEYNIRMMDHDVVIPKTIKFDKIRNKQLLQTFKPVGLKKRINRYLSNHRTLKNNIYKIIGNKIISRI